MELIPKAGPSSDWSLQLDSMKLESLVILNQNVRVNTFPGVVQIPEVGSLTFLEGANQGRTGDWSEVVTRYPYRKVGMDHLLSMEKDNRN